MNIYEKLLNLMKLLKEKKEQIIIIFLKMYTNLSMSNILNYLKYLINNTPKWLILVISMSIIKLAHKQYKAKFSHGKDVQLRDFCYEPLRILLKLILFPCTFYYYLIMKRSNIKKYAGYKIKIKDYNDRNYQYIGKDKEL